MTTEEHIKFRHKKREKTFWYGFLSFVSFFTSFYFIFRPESIAEYLKFQDDTVIFSGIVLFIVGLGFFLNLYLYIKPYRFGFPISDREEDLNRIFNFHLKKNLTDKYGDTYERFDLGEKETEQKPKLFENELESFKEKFITQSTHELEFAHLFEELYKLENKFKSQIERLIGNSNLNLSIGTIFTSVAILILGLSIFQDHNFTSYLELFSFFIPRVSTVILVEIFSFFFLRLYKNNLDEIKYFQNEISNLNFKIASLKTAIKIKDNDTINQIAKEFSNTERNKNIQEVKQTKYSKEFSPIINDINKLIKTVQKN